MGALRFCLAMAVGYGHVTYIRGYPLLPGDTGGRGASRPSPEALQLIWRCTIANWPLNPFRSLALNHTGRSGPPTGNIAVFFEPIGSLARLNMRSVGR